MKKFFIFLSLVAFSMIAVSCGSDDDDGNDGNVNCDSSFSINSELNDEINAFTQAASNYGQDPTPENCEAYKDAAQDYFEALEALRDCAEQAGLLSSYNQSLANVQAAFDEIDC